MDEIIKILDEKTINSRIVELAEEINKDYEGEELLVVPVLNGGFMIASELIKRLTVPVTLDFVITSSYKDDTISSGNVEMIKDLDTEVTGKNVLLIDDIIDSGRTLAYLKEILNRRGPKSISICTLLDKPERREMDIDSDYVGFTIENEFVIGYGLDYKGLYRNLPYVGKIKKKEF